MSYESPFKTSRVPALPEIIFHVFWLIQTRSNYHLQKTWRKLEKDEKGRRRTNHPLSSFFTHCSFFHSMHPPARLHRRFISHFRFTFCHFVTLLFYFLFIFDYSSFPFYLFVVFVYLKFMYLFTLLCFYILHCFTIFILLSIYLLKLSANIIKLCIISTFSF